MKADEREQRERDGGVEEDGGEGAEVGTGCQATNDDIH